MDFRARTFQYYGSKYRLAPLYPEPNHNTIIEPFAGSAAYSLLHGARRFVILYDANPKVVAVWKWLIGAKKSEIEALPIPKQGETVSSYGLNPEAEFVIRSFASPGARHGDTIHNQSRWTENARAIVAETLQHIRHYEIHCGDYSFAPDERATWFIDPPYEYGGHQYKFNKIDRPVLYQWCLSRQGQTLICERDDQSWLPNPRPLLTLKGHHKSVQTEVLLEICYPVYDGPKNDLRPEVKA